MAGFMLEEYEIGKVQEKAYGPMPAKVGKILDSFKRFDKSLGTILSGPKGIGKSSFAKLLAEEAVHRGYPVIVIDSHLEGVHSFLEEIHQEVLVLFDEFEKNFAITRNKEDDPNNAQTTFLSLFDGLSHGKKLYVITCNNIYHLDEYLLNRPGRFHYHLRFSYPGANEIEVYMKDRLKKTYHKEINKIIIFSEKVKLNYDCLKAIAYELNNGDPFENIINDLNILNLMETRYDVTLYLSNGEIMTDTNNKIDFFSEKPVYLTDFRNSFGYDSNYRVVFNPTDYEFQRDSGTFVIPADKVKIYPRRDSEHKEDIGVERLIIIKSRWENYNFNLR